jgi:hypothetical protein
VDRINITRVVLGGLAAGLVINIGEFILNEVVLASRMDAAMARLNLPPIGGTAITAFVILGFVLGIAMTWLYAAIRPRFGAGPTTAAFAGTAVWGFSCLYPNLSLGVAGMFPTDLLMIATVWALVETIAGAVAGAYVYQEAGTGAPVRA